MNKPVFYLIPGLRADERVFQRLRPLLRGESQVLPWLPPEAADEPLPRRIRSGRHFVALSRAEQIAGIPNERD